MKSSPRVSLSTIIERVLREEVTAPDAVRQCESSWDARCWDEDMNHAYHMLIHYLDDADVRAKDAGYAEWQRRGLADLAERLRR
jgi:hypothetical protein